MGWIIENWYMLIAIVCVLGFVGMVAKDFYLLPSDQQITKVKEWLLYAVFMAEEELGSGTGKLKLRWCYDKFVSKFPYLVRIVPFDVFANWVDDALEEMKKLLETNDNVKHILEVKN